MMRIKKRHDYDDNDENDGNDAQPNVAIRMNEAMLTWQFICDSDGNWHLFCLQK